MWFPNRSDTNRAIQSLKMARGWKVYNCTIRVVKTKVLITFAVAEKLICAIVIPYAGCWFSDAAAHIIMFVQHTHEFIPITKALIHTLDLATLCIIYLLYYCVI